ncbi:hypothetical protein KKF91_17725 [Myxococcota bacterium]|nr:hypothetical protein [Myxococcota bacterium]
MLITFSLACTTKGPSAPAEAPTQAIDPAQIKTLRDIAKRCEEGAYKSRELCPEWRFHESRLRRRSGAFDLKRAPARARIEGALSLLDDEGPWVRRIARGLLAMALPLVNKEDTHARMLNALIAQLKSGDEETQLDVLNITHDDLTAAQQPLLMTMTEAPSTATRAMAWRALSGCLKRGCKLAPEEIIERYEAEREPVVRAGLILIAGRGDLQRVYDWCAGWEGPIDGVCRNIFLERDTPQAQQLLKARAARHVEAGEHGRALHALSDVGHTSLAKAEWLSLMSALLDDPKTPLLIRQKAARLLVLGKDHEEVLTFARARLARAIEDDAEAPLKQDLDRVIKALEEKPHDHGAHGHGAAAHPKAEGHAHQAEDHAHQAEDHAHQAEDHAHQAEGHAHQAEGED